MSQFLNMSFFYVKQVSFEIHLSCYSAFLGGLCFIISYTMNEPVTTDFLSIHRLQIFSMRNLLILPQIFIYSFIYIVTDSWISFVCFVSEHFILSGTMRWSNFILYISCFNPRIKSFFKGPWLFLLNNGIVSKILVLSVLIVSRLCNWHSKKTFTCLY